MTALGEKQYKAKGPYTMCDFMPFQTKVDNHDRNVVKSLLPSPKRRSQHAI